MTFVILEPSKVAEEVNGQGTGKNRDFEEFENIHEFMVVGRISSQAMKYRRKWRWPQVGTGRVIEGVSKRP
jgi:hypothetical protein